MKTYVLKSCFAFSLLLCISFGVRAQQVDAFFQVGIPMNDFSESTDAIGFGGGGSIIAPLGESPFYLGGQFDYMLYGRSVTDIRANIAGFTREYELIRQNNIIQGHLMMRLQPRGTDFPVMPYIDGLFGFRHLYTRTRLQDANWNPDPDDNDNGNRTLDAETNISDWALSYGGAVGIHFLLGDVVRINMRCTYLVGTEAEYVDKQSVEVSPTDPSQVTFNPKRSSTDMLIPQLGLTFYIR